MSGQLASNFPHRCMARRRTVGEILVCQIMGNTARDVLANTGNPIQRGNFGGHNGPYLETQVANLLQTFHTAVWPGDGQWVKFWSAKSWATQLEMSLQTQGTLSKGAILGVCKDISSWVAHDLADQNFTHRPSPGHTAV